MRSTTTTDEHRTAAASRPSVHLNALSGGSPADVHVVSYWHVLRSARVHRSALREHGPGSPVNRGWELSLHLTRRNKPRHPRSTAERALVASCSKVFMILAVRQTVSCDAQVEERSTVLLFFASKAPWATFTRSRGRHQVEPVTPCGAHRVIWPSRVRSSSFSSRLTRGKRRQRKGRTVMLRCVRQGVIHADTVEYSPQRAREVFRCYIQHHLSAR